jgi:hypothetical protein
VSGPSPGEEAVDEEIDEQLEPLVGVALGIGAGDRNEVGEPCPPVTLDPPASGG